MTSLPAFLFLSFVKLSWSARLFPQLGLSIMIYRLGVYPFIYITKASRDIPLRVGDQPHQEPKDMDYADLRYTPGTEASGDLYHYDFNAVSMSRSDSSGSTTISSTTEIISPPSPLQVFNMTVSNIFEMANDATLAAQVALDNQYRGEMFMPLVMTPESVQEAIQRAKSRQRDYPERVGVQDVLTKRLHHLFSRHGVNFAPISVILQEAAYHLLLHLDGFNVLERCRLAIAAVLESVQAKLKQASSQ